VTSPGSLSLVAANAQPLTFPSEKTAAHRRHEWHPGETRRLRTRRALIQPHLGESRTPHRVSGRTTDSSDGDTWNRHTPNSHAISTVRATVCSSITVFTSRLAEQISSNTLVPLPFVL
jgi:hypothetical protein